jgi:PPOX class probable F420-dependent enzyme
VATPPATAVDAPAQEATDGYFSPLAPAKHVLLATFKWGRTPVTIPARVVAEGDRAYFQTWSTSITARRLRHNDWVQAAPCAALGLYRYGPWLDATARLLDGEEAGQAARKLAGKHPGRPGGWTSLAHRLRGARPVHCELQPCGRAGAPGEQAPD